MKFRTQLLLIVALLALAGMNSCTKKYTCHCNIHYTGVPGMPDSTFNEYDIRDTKGKAEDLCKKNSATFDNAGVHTVEECYLY